MNVPPPSHVPVLAGPIQAIAQGARRVVDATLGHGGHAALFIAAGAELLGIDRDPDALAIARARLAGAPVTFLAASFGDATTHRAVAEFRPDLILLDLGVSSRQLDDDPRGFTFRPGAPLDMRMDRAGVTAADLLNGEGEAELAALFRDFGDERRARALAREVVRRRARGAFAVSDDFVNAIRAVLGPQSGAADFARLFQALRIVVNGELEALERSLPAFLDALMPGGTLAVISYHSGEDRIVKHQFREWARACVCPPEQPVCTCRGRPLGAVEPRRAITADVAEVDANPRARSARLRIFRKAA
ncbi:MAG: 16S rRNA (cytosine(1402)-N(4))-methyltransferase RsmH [Gemmatimonadales bacterium]